MDPWLVFGYAVLILTMIGLAYILSQTHPPDADVFTIIGYVLGLFFPPIWVAMIVSRIRGNKFRDSFRKLKTPE